MHQHLHQHHQQQQGLSSSVRGAASHSSLAPDNDSGKAGVGVRAGGAAAGYRIQTAWEQRPGRQQAASDVSDEFPFPDKQGQNHNTDGVDGPRGQSIVAAENDGNSALSGGTASRPAAAAITRRSSRSAEKGNRRLSRSGSGSHSHERLHMHTFSSRRRSSSSFGSPDRGPSSPGWPSYARCSSGADATESGGVEWDEADRNPQPAPGNVPTAVRHLARHKDNNSLDHAPLGVAWGQEGAGGEAQGSHGAPVTQRHDTRVATAQDQEPDFDAAGRKDWVENAGAWGEEGGGREAAGGPRRREWNGSVVGGSGGEGHPQAGERMVDEDAYRFRSFSEEVSWCDGTVFVPGVTCHLCVSRGGHSTEPQALPSSNWMPTRR